MEETLYQFCGYDYGSWTARDTGELRDYCTIYCVSPLDSRKGCFRAGYKADKFSCVGPDVFKGIEPQDNVKLYFNRYGRVTHVEKVSK